MWLKKKRRSLPYFEILEDFENKMLWYLKEAMIYFPTRNFMPDERIWKHRTGQQRLFKETKREILFKYIKRRYGLNEKEYKRIKNMLIKDSTERLMALWGKFKK